ncbi:MAG: GIY-YIG nuclease family protein [Pseudomonadota bacterium]
MDKEKLLALIADDDLGLLHSKSKIRGSITSDQRLIASFQEINKFIEQHGREPAEDNDDIHEFKLHQRLQNIRSDNNMASSLIECDQFNLLANKKQISSIEDIFDDDDLGLLDDATNSIFNLKHVPKGITAPDYIAKRKPCSGFEEFEYLFKQCHKDLASKKRILLAFHRYHEIDKGMFFVLKGMLVYIAYVEEKIKDRHGKWDARLRAIFENGTESDLLLRSLGKELFKDGKRVTYHEDELLNPFDNVTSEDQETGYIYILKSQSEQPAIKAIEHLYKIGFSSIKPEERIKNAFQEPTYLNAPVKLVSAYQCYNLNPQKLELMLHMFFGKACLNIDLYDKAGKRHTPREWFVAPLEVIERVIKLVMTGDIVDYQYDEDNQEINKIT